MQINGVIKPQPESHRLTFDTWCEFVAGRSEFRRPQPTETRNPFGGEAITIQPSDDVVDIEVDGCVVGNAFWSMSEEAVVNVTIDEPHLPLVSEWAEELDGVFHPDM